MKKNKRNSEPKLHAVVAPRKKEVHIRLGNKLLKKYKFQMTIPSKVVEKEFHGYDWWAWCVSDRDFTYTKEVVEWCEKTMNSIKEKALSAFLKSKEQ